MVGSRGVVDRGSAARKKPERSARHQLQNHPRKGGCRC